MRLPLLAGSRPAHVGAFEYGSSRPATCPHQMAAQVEARVVELRLAHPGLGPRTIAHYLAREGVQPLPARSSIYRCLVRHRLVDPRRRRRKRADYRRWERARAMELWRMDVMGGVKLEGGGELKLVSGLDDHSRFCVSALLTHRATARPVCEAPTAAMARHGVPEQVLTDNGKVLTARFGRGSGLSGRRGSSSPTGDDSTTACARTAHWGKRRPPRRRSSSRASHWPTTGLPLLHRRRPWS
jgi:hypothetical protein